LDNRPEFHWGVATSAQQTEGFPDFQGRTPSIWDVFAEKKRKITGGHRPDQATEFFRYYREDVALAARLGIPNLRFSISWPRVKPNGYGKTNENGLDFYDRLTDACLEFGITPWVTLYHWDLPQILQDKGGWVNRDVLGWFEDYSGSVLKRLSDRVVHWMSLNEPLAFTGAGYFLGIHAPGKTGLSNFLPAMHHAILAQADGIRQIKSYKSNLIAGTTFSCAPVVPDSSNPKDQGAALRADALFNRLFVEPLIGYGYPIKELSFLRKVGKWMMAGDESRMIALPSFIGLQNYTRETVKHVWWVPYLQAKKTENSSNPRNKTMIGWDIYPEGLYQMIHKFSAYPEIKSVIVTENGAAFPDQVDAGRVNDKMRISYLDQYISATLKARAEGAKVNGYFAWSLTDNFEWSEGYFPRFGLTHINYATQRRTIKDSGFWYGDYIRKQTQST
jgi:beta-glucosidase